MPASSKCALRASWASGSATPVPSRGSRSTGRINPGEDWQSPNYASATHRADLTVNVNLGNVEINPIGGCK